MEFRAGQQLPAGLRASTVLADMDFETYSEAGFIWDEAGQKWRPPAGATRGGIAAVGARVYSEHPSTEVLSLAYNLKDERGPQLWLPGMPEPADLFEHIARGGLVEAWNDSFEYWIWLNVCHARMGWPALPFWQLRDAAAKARAFALPGALGKAAEVMGGEQKLADGKNLIKFFCVPRKPTKNNPATRNTVSDHPAKAVQFYHYNLQDIVAESDISGRCPDLPPGELDFWLCTRACNVRGTAIDVESVRGGVAVLEQALAKYDAELQQLTGGAVARASEVQKTIDYLGTRGVRVSALDEAAVSEALARPDLPADARRILEIRQLGGSAGVKKLYALQRLTGKDGRVSDMFVYHRARTGRDGGEDVQPQNLPKAGPALRWCGESTCKKPYGAELDRCPWCGTREEFSDSAPWSWEAVDHALQVIRTGRLDLVEQYYGQNALLTLGGCIRGLFVAGPGKELLCSDYSSIEAVVTAMLAGESWRIEAFQRREDIYLVSAGRITGRTLDEYAAHKAETGQHHPDRQKIGKPAELGLGFGGWINAWLQFDKSGTFTEGEIRKNILAWRDASPAIVELWGGQCRGKPWAPICQELYGLEGMAIAAVMEPGRWFTYRLIGFYSDGRALYARLPSGRLLTYHAPRLAPSTRWEGQQELSFEGYNSNPKMGPIGWIRINTYGGRLTENVVQATARDIMAHAVVQLERAGYPIVLRVHDELVAEVPEGSGSVEQFEQIMGAVPGWAAGWPVRASGGWRGKRYRKD